MGKFVVIGEIIDQQRTWQLHLNVESILYFEAAPAGTLGKTRINLMGGPVRGNFVHVHDDVQTLAAKLSEVTGPVAALTHLSGMSNDGQLTYVLPTQVLSVIDLRPRPVKGQMATVKFNDGTQLDVEDAGALIALL